MQTEGSYNREIGNLIRLGENWSKNNLSKLSKTDQKLIKTALEKIPTTQLNDTEIKYLKNILSSDNLANVKNQKFTSIFQRIHSPWSKESKLHTQIKKTESMHRKDQINKPLSDSMALKEVNRYFKSRKLSSKEKKETIDLSNQIITKNPSPEAIYRTLRFVNNSLLYETNPETRESIINCINDLSKDHPLEKFIGHFEDAFNTVNKQVVIENYNKLLVPGMNINSKLGVLFEVVDAFKQLDKKTAEVVVKSTLNVLEEMDRKGGNSEFTVGAHSARHQLLDRITTLMIEIKPEERPIILDFIKENIGSYNEFSDFKSFLDEFNKFDNKMGFIQLIRTIKADNSQITIAQMSDILKKLNSRVTTDERDRLLAHFLDTVELFNIENGDWTDFIFNELHNATSMRRTQEGYWVFSPKIPNRS